MIRGPVCVGNIATYAIKDYFWVFFVNPDSDPSVKFPELGLKSWKDFMSFDAWRNAAYEKAYAKTLGSYKPEGYDIGDVWDGNKTNPNAWLTILRNETNATVMKGRKGVEWQARMRLVVIWLTLRNPVRALVFQVALPLSSFLALVEASNLIVSQSVHLHLGACSSKVSVSGLVVGFEFSAPIVDID